MALQWGICVAFIIVCVLLSRYLKFFQLSGINPLILPTILLLKIAAGFSYIFLLPDAGDTQFFFRKGLVLGEFLKGSPFDLLKLIIDPDRVPGFLENNKYWEKQYSEIIPDDNKSILLFHALCSFFSAGLYHTHVVIANFLALIGLCGIYKFLSNGIKSNYTALLLIICLSPTVLFWGSSMLKEPLLLFVFGLSLHELRRYNTSRTALNFLYLIFFISMSLFIKPYVMLIALPGFAAMIWNARNKNTSIVPFVSTYASAIILLFLLSFVSTHYNLAMVLQDKQDNFIEQSIQNNISTNIDLPTLDGSWNDLILGAPKALSATFIQPLFTFKSGGLKMLSAIELLLIYLFCLFLVLKPKNNFRIPAEFYFSLFFVLVFLMFLGYLIPFSGTMVRLKMTTIPFLLFIFLSVSKRQFSS